MKPVQTLIRPSLDKRGYRLRCRFKIDAYPWPSVLGREKVRMAERFVRDMAKQGWVYDDRFGFHMTGPYPRIEPVTIHIGRRPSAREMLPYVVNGARFLDEGGTAAGTMPKLIESEYWEFELSAIFIRAAILVETAELHEESYR